MKTLNIRIRRGPQGYGMSVVYRGLDKYDRNNTGIFVSQVVPGEAAVRAGLNKDDRILRINKKSPRNIEEAIEILRKSKSYIEVVVQRQDLTELNNQETDDEFEIANHKREIANKQREAHELYKDESESDLSSKRMSIREYENESEVEEKYKRQMKLLDFSDDKPPIPILKHRDVKSLDRKSHRKVLRSSSPTSSMISAASLSSPNVTSQSRHSEKKQLQGLNSRLAGLIDKVRELQTENAKMTRRKTVLEDHQEKEIENVKKNYEDEKGHLKDALEELSKKYKDLKLTANGLVKENDELQERNKLTLTQLNKNTMERIPKLQKEKQNHRENVIELESIVKDMKTDLENIQSKKESLTKKNDDILLTKDDIANQNSELETKLKEESEKAKEKNDHLLEEINEAKLLKMEEINEMKQEYENKIKATLTDLRNTNEKNLEQDRKDLKDKYENVLNDLQTSLSEEASRNNNNIEDNIEKKKKIIKIEDKIEDLLKKIEDLKEREKEKLKEKEMNEEKNKDQLLDKDEEIFNILEKTSKLEDDFKNLQETKNALDTEIAVYRKLMETEEDRLGIQPDDSVQSSAVTPDVCKTENKEQKTNLTMTQTLL